MEQFIQYVENTIAKYNQHSTLVNNNEVSPYLVCLALADYMYVNNMLLAEYQRRKVELCQVQDEFDDWMDDKFYQTRQAMITANAAKTSKIAVKEIDNRVKVENKDDYKAYRNKVREADFKVSFIRRLLESWKKLDSILCTLSSNLRTEMKALSLQDRINKSDKSENNTEGRKTRW
jgi:hypothetical protein